MKPTLLLIVTLALVMPLSAAFAQEGGELQCDEGAVADELTRAIDTLTSAQSETLASQYEAAVQVRRWLGALDAECLGLDLGGSRNTVYDPMFIPAGIYRATLKAPADSQMALEGILLDGRCAGRDQPGMGFRPFAIGAAEDVSEGTETMFRSEGCTVLWNVFRVDGPYSVTFEKLD